MIKIFCIRLRSEWKTALSHAESLEGCQWSPATFAYVRAVLLYMIMLDEDKPELQQTIYELLK
jgi:hypothetical protein